MKQPLDPILGAVYNVSIANPFLGGHLSLNGRVKYKQCCSLKDGGYANSVRNDSLLKLDGRATLTVHHFG